MPSKVEIAKVDAKLPVFETSWTEHLDEHKQSILDHKKEFQKTTKDNNCLLYTSDAADDTLV